MVTIQKLIRAFGWPHHGAAAAAAAGYYLHSIQSKLLPNLVFGRRTMIILAYVPIAMEICTRYAKRNLLLISEAK